MAEEIYVVVAENDQYCKASDLDSGYYDDNGPIVLETLINKSSIEHAEKLIVRLDGKYGKCRIAKLNFIDK